MGEDLIQCKSVCKSRKSLISSRRFLELHRNYNRKKKAHNNEIGDTRIACDSNYYRLVGSSNGILCISGFHSEFFVVNPSTREVKELRNPSRDIDIQVSGFGYDSSIDDFKVVIGSYDEYSDNCVFEVLTLKSNVWRSVSVELDRTVNGGQIGTLCNGAIHWLWHHDFSDKEVIVSFDLSTEVIKEIPAPDWFKSNWHIYGWRWRYLGTINDHLCIIPYQDIHLKKTEEIEIWVLKNYNARESWERWSPPPGYEGQKTIMDYYPHSRFLDGHVHIWMLEEGAGAPVLVHSLERPGQNAHIKLSAISECNCNFALPVFVKSLVSLSGVGEEESGDAVLVPSHVSLKDLECRTVCNKSQRFAKISQDQKASLRKKVKEIEKKSLRPKHKARGKTKTYVTEDEEGTDMSGDEDDGILDPNLKRFQIRTYTFKDFLLWIEGRLTCLEVEVMIV